MALTATCNPDNFTACPGDTVSRKLSLAVRLVDDFAKSGPAGGVSVKIKEKNLGAVRNLSGYYLFVDLAPGNYTVATDTEYYFPQETGVDTSVLDPKNPVKEITLIPGPSYPFPGNATLARGILKAGPDPVADAAIKVTGKSVETRTNACGEFALYFKGIRSETITIEIIKGSAAKSVDATIEEGRTISMGVISYP